MIASQSSHDTDVQAVARGDAALAEELGLLIDGATTYAIYMLDPQGRVTIWNRGAERIKGWAEAEIIGRDFAIFYPADDIAADKPAADLARAHGCGRIEEESWRVRKDGSEFLAHVTITALHDDAGALRGFGKVIRDITHEKAAEAAIVRREHHLRSILNTVPDAMIVMNENGIVASFSAAAELVFGYAAVEVIGQNVAMLMPQAEARDHDAHLRKYRHTGERHVIGNVRLERAMRKGARRSRSNWRSAKRRSRVNASLPVSSATSPTATRPNAACRSCSQNSSTSPASAQWARWRRPSRTRSTSRSPRSPITWRRRAR
ncbi:PAS domain S-box protein [Sphingomonas sp. 22L2VL55-3]